MCVHYKHSYERQIYDYWSLTSLQRKAIAVCLTILTKGKRVFVITKDCDLAVIVTRKKYLSVEEKEGCRVEVCSESICQAAGNPMNNSNLDGRQLSQHPLL